MRPAVAVALLLAIGLGLIGVLVLTEHTQMVSMVPMENPPEVLASKARDIVRSLGYGGSPADVAYGFRHERGYLEYMAPRISRDRSGLAQWKEVLRIRPGPVSFWYSQSEGPLVPPVAYTGKAIPIDSLPAVRGGVSVDLDLDGRLLRFVASPAAERLSATATGVTDWRRLFAVAGVDPSGFKETTPKPAASTQTDARVAWSGPYPGRPDLPVRVEGGAWAGTATSFEVLFPWTKRDPMFAARTHYAIAVVLITIPIAPVLVAGYNWRRGRADLRGALRIGTVVFLAHLGSLLLNAHQALDAFVTRPVFWLALALGAWAAILYIALEPWVRRWWPYAMVGWARVVAGRWHDPLVARDVLVGMALMITYRCVYLMAVLAGIYQGAAPVSVGSMDSLLGEFVLSQLGGARFAAANILHCVSIGIAGAAVSFFLLAMFRALLRNPWLGTAAFCALSSLWSSLQPEFRGEWMTIATYPIFLAVWIFGAVRYGLLAVVIGSCAYRILAQSILTADFGAWYGQSSLLAVLLVAALGIWAFRVSLGAQLRTHEARALHMPW